MLVFGFALSVVLAAGAAAIVAQTTLLQDAQRETRGYY